MFLIFVAAALYCLLLFFSSFPLLQLVAGLYTVIGMPSDALAQIINAAMARRSFEFNSNDKQTKINKRKQIRKYIFQIAAVTAGISAAAQLAACAFCKKRQCLLLV